MEQFSLRWNNFHSNITTGFQELLQAHDLVDVTLSVEGRFLRAHKLVLSICSPFFKEIFKANPCKHPVIVLRDFTYTNLNDILEFMYLGEVNILRDNLPSFLRTAELLQVKGLTGDDSESSYSGEAEEEPLPLTTSIQVPQVKRRSKSTASSKRVKSVTTQDEGDVKVENVEAAVENNEVIRQLLENNHDPGIQDDPMLFSTDPKTHVYCPYCYRKFVNRYNLKVHIRDKHDNNPINLDCIVCGKTMRNRSCLRVHLYHHRKQQVQMDHPEPAESKII